MNFNNIDYLQHGNDRQRQVYSILANNKVLSKLKQFDPIIVGTIPIKIDIENHELSAFEGMKNLLLKLPIIRKDILGEVDAIQYPY